MLSLFNHISLSYVGRVISTVLIITLVDLKLTGMIPYTVPSPRSPVVEYVPGWAYQLGVTGFTLCAIFLSRMRHVWPYLLVYIVPLQTWYCANNGNYWNIIWSVFGVIPLLELVSGQDGSNPTPQEEIELNKRFSFRLVTMLWVPVQILFLLWGSWAVTNWSLSTIDFVLLSVSIGFNTGILGINISHELIHKNTYIEQLLGKILLVTVCYTHWYIEHLWGHHKRVSTPEDPATSRIGETFYSFWPRSVVGTVKSAWYIEQQRLSKKNLTLWHNQFLILQGASVATSVVIAGVWGQKAFIMFFIQSVVAFSLLEIVNYIEHYGLMRRQTGKGKDDYEPVNPTHSWNANARVTNFFLFKLQRHSDHHAYAGRRYQILRSFDDAPQMPTGYAGMLLMALVPPLWFRVMNPRAKTYYHHQQQQQ